MASRRDRTQRARWGTSCGAIPTTGPAIASPSVFAPLIALDDDRVRDEGDRPREVEVVEERKRAVVVEGKGLPADASKDERSIRPKSPLCCAFCSQTVRLPGSPSVGGGA